MFEYVLDLFKPKIKKLLQTVAWWGTYSSGGSKGDDPHYAWVPQGSDREMRKYIEE